ncbi:tetratricopeptide repeat protein [Prosthecomicrobium sp. N25]|uniref:tetratricopeptide repeat protein n=1 Tax=Prosthecomicrobium sp. N25 TaxID=3129254 RepID=UPI00307808BC
MTDLEPDDVRALADLGFLALSRGLGVEAEAIFEALRAVRPGEEAPLIGLGLVRLAAGEFDRAVAQFRAAPKTDAALTFLGIALLRQGALAEARRVLETVAAAGEGGPADLARQTLAEIG